ncbi:hypothetical protein GCM10011316_20390 [Roseibium aquae]|uniref:Uncharacterized protein n=1 Tax=Roseibium aquae TaxID=1323746 RepID=A0A916TJT1_9HYPH|nr:hypothetical protein GCM10011316_20390 [Roseibium aquae]
MRKNITTADPVPASKFHDEFTCAEPTADGRDRPLTLGGGIMRLAATTVTVSPSPFKGDMNLPCDGRVVAARFGGTMHADTHDTHGPARKLPATADLKGFQIMSRQRPSFSGYADRRAA